MKKYDIAERIIIMAMIIILFYIMVYLVVWQVSNLEHIIICDNQTNTCIRRTIDKNR